MLANNLLFFITFVIYFRNFSSLRGWVREDLALLVGCTCWAFGLAVFLTGGIRDLANMIASGGLDAYLGRPRHPLPALLLSQSIPAGLGDMVSASATLFQCLAFWLSGAAVLAEELFEMFMMVAYYPENPFSLAVRLLLLTVFPAGFVAMMPAEAVRDADARKLAACAAAALVYAGLAWLVFERGLRRYTSGSRIIELR
jgi:ABC-2 type transport system permease protein